MATGQIFDVQRFSIHDGPGIRTTVFLKGCPLRCLWCGNPESIPVEPLLSYRRESCIACGACVKVCAPKALSTDAGGKAVVDRQRCTGCGACPPVCDPKALEIVGRSVTVAEVLEVVLRDEAYYEESGGGMTLSGGEPLMQPDFAKALSEEAKSHRLHTAVETSGYAIWGAIRPLLPTVDLWLFDYKETDPQRHEKYIGKPRELILSNLRQLYREGANIVLRCPLIPGNNARPDHLDGIVSLVKDMPNIRGVDLLPYYDLWRASWNGSVCRSELPATVRPPERSTVDGWKDYLRTRGVQVLG